jgi:tetratricopeptide (TPR) repeat protein
MDGTWAELMEEGKRHYLAGEYPESTHSLRAAAELRPDSVETWRALGFALKSAGNPSDAIASFKTAIGLDSLEADSYYGLGLVQFESGDTPTAIQSFDTATTIKPSHSRARAALVGALIKEGLNKLDTRERREGAALLARAFELQPGSIETATAYTDYLVAEKKYLEAFEAAQRAKIAAPHDQAIMELHTTLETDPRVERAMREHGFV